MDPFFLFKEDQWIISWERALRLFTMCKVQMLFIFNLNKVFMAEAAPFVAPRPKGVNSIYIFKSDNRFQHIISFLLLATYFFILNKKAKRL